MNENGYTLSNLSIHFLKKENLIKQINQFLIKKTPYKLKRAL